MRKISFFLSIIVIFSLSINTSFAFYNDVSPSNQHYASIKALYDANLLPDSENFHPNDPLTHGDLYELLISFSLIPLSSASTLPYSDISTESTYAPYIQTALELKILSPTTTTFEPNKYITKGKALETMFKSLGIGQNYFFDRDNFTFTDLDKNSQIAPLAQKASEIGILEPYSPTLFKSFKRVTRGEAADYLYKIYEYNILGQLEIVYTLEDPIKNSSKYSFTKTESKLIDNQSFETLLDVWGTLHTDYLYKDQIKDSDLILGAIEGMVNQANDNYTVFEKPEEKNILEQLSSEYEGIGVSIETIEGKITIISPLKGSPAEKAGLKAADIIIKVDHKDVTKETITEVVNKIKGPSGTSVKIGVLRDGKEFTFDIKRENLFYETVSCKFLTKETKKIAYLELKSFNDKTYEEFLKAAKEIVAQNADGLILDLRNNPGGYLDTAVDIIELFLETSKTAIKMELSTNDVKSYKANGNGILKDLKTIILINKGSASASEVLAGALQDYQIATLIGEKSFGKGTVQTVEEYKDESVLKYTTAKWLTPNGRDINKKGLTPDKQVLKTTKNDTQLNAALNEF